MQPCQAFTLHDDSILYLALQLNQLKTCPGMRSSNVLSDGGGDYWRPCCVGPSTLAGGASSCCCGAC
eukprot:12377948-Prorocentrum_lima.AAC.1